MKKQPFTVLVCGGRDYDNWPFVEATLDDLAKEKGPIILVQGGATGADAWARQWARRQSVATLWHMINMPADWKKNGRAAGPIRNKRMLTECLPDLVVAFPGGRGTSDMCGQAKKAGVPILLIADHLRNALDKK